MGNYSESFKILNSKSDDLNETENFIIFNTPENLRKKLWEDTFYYSSKNLFETSKKFNDENSNKVEIEKYFVQLTKNFVSSFEKNISNKLKDDIIHYSNSQKNIEKNIDEIERQSNINRHEIPKCEIYRNYKIDHCINEIYINNNNKSTKDLEKLKNDMITLKNANDVLVRKVIDFQDNESSLKNNIDKLKLKLEQANQQIIELEEQIGEYKNFISSYNVKNKNNTEKKKVLQYVDELIKKEKEINEIKSRYPCELLKGEKMLCLCFISLNEDIHYSIICKNTDKFSSIEESFYEKYPELIESVNSFICNGQKIKRFKTLEENKILDNDIIYF